MPPIIEVGDQPILVPTADFPYGKWNFKEFNPVQSRIIDFYDQEANILVAAPTSSGKTVIAEQMLSHEIRKRGGKGIFLAPLRALSQEKIDDWKSPKHHFSDKKIAICTGDYRLTNSRLKELEEADIIVMTSEILNSRCRNKDSEKSQFLEKIGTIVLDESHVISTSRGPHIEVGLMKFTQINPNARIVLLSATMPNVKEMAEWVSYSLTGRTTYVVKSDFRPTKLVIHYEKYEDAGKYDQVEQQKVDLALDIVESYPDDKFLIFAHTKKTGEIMKTNLKKLGIQAEFHNANLDKEKRIDIEHRFRTDPKLRVIVATSTIAYGLNMPARRVIILGVHRGLDEVDSFDIIQEVGRAGRFGLDPMGDAYILLPESRFDEFKAKMGKPKRIESQLLEKAGNHYKVLAFHLVSEIHHRFIKTSEDVHNWYKRSFASFQSHEFDDKIVDDTLNLLRKRGIIREDNGEWKVTAVGMISSMFYYSPFDVADLKQNFDILFGKGKENDDYTLSIALGDIDTQRNNIVSRAEKEEMGTYQAKIQMMGYLSNDAAIKAGFCYYMLLNGKNPPVLAGMQRNLQFDFERMSQVIQSLDTMSSKWDQHSFLKTLEARIRHGVPAHLTNLCQIPNIGKVRAKKLYDAGIKSVEAFSQVEPAKLRGIINVNDKIIQEMLKDVAGVLLTT